MLTSINNTFFNRNIATTKMKNRNDMVSTKVAQLVEEKKLNMTHMGILMLPLYAANSLLADKFSEEHIRIQATQDR